MFELIPSRLADALHGAVEGAFATTAFLFPEPLVHDDGADDGAPAMTAVVEFTAPVHGYVAVRCPCAFLPVLTTNITGDSGSATEEFQRDALGEIANVVCGNVLPILYPSDRFTLHTPVVTPTDGAPEIVTETPESSSLAFDIDGYRVEATCVIDSHAAAA
jgi:hypothetical protein